MSLWAILPAREDGKSRLAEVLSQAERRDLSERLFRHSLRIVAEVVGAERCLVVSRSAVFRAIAPQAIAETGDGLNPALEQAAAEARTRGATAVLSVACDLPLLTSEDLRAMIAEAAELVIAPDQAGTGTNALLARRAIPYRHGPDSRALHEKSASSVAIVAREGLARDLDMPCDLEALAEALKRVHIQG